MSKHTPGPWTWLPTDAKDRDVLVGAAGKKVLWPVSGWDKADLGIRTGAWGCEEVEANAALIAAAPDLLEALVASMPFIRSELNGSSDEDILRQCEAAIAKATK